MAARLLSKRVCSLSRHFAQRSTHVSSTKVALGVSSRHFSQWAHVEMGPPDPILGVAEAFKACTDSRKVNVSIGAYRDDNGKPVILPSVAEAEKRVLAQPGYNHEYAPIGGIPELKPLVQKLALGEDATGLENVVTMQALSGTGSLRVLSTFIATYWKDKSNLPTVHIPQPTWGAHPAIFAAAGLNTAQYPYYDPSTIGLNFSGMMDYLKQTPENDVIMLHSTAHNPTGVDPTPEQWDELCNFFKGRQNLVFFDMAYQGFASGDCDKDAYGMRSFYQAGIPLLLAQSFAKNFGLYGQRAGAAHIVCSNPDEAAKVESQFKRVCRATWSNPPLHGGRIVAEILKDPALKQQWLDDVKTMANRIIDMRTLLRSKLEAATGKEWKHVTDQIGMFTFTGMTEAQVTKITEDYAIYMTKNGRISMAGVNSSNVDYLANSIAAVTK